jgi:hypothetical protein
MVPRATGTYRWDIAVKAEFANGDRRSALLRTNARPWTRRDIERVCNNGALRLAGWHRITNFGEVPRIVAAFTRVRRPPLASGRSATRSRKQR